VHCSKGPILACFRIHSRRLYSKTTLVKSFPPLVTLGSTTVAVEHARDGSVGSAFLSRGGGIDRTAWRKVRSIAERSGSCGDRQLSDCTGLYDNRSHLTRSQVPANMAVQGPHAWVISNNAKDGMRIPWDDNRIATWGIGSVE